ncbi:tRNA lysidine(34) synthetase TilS [Faecalicatena contorta]|uniref:tRNA lysidine(34) synthetase TilS n=1 Tax=Faecalicatena contorta TaxID=39482 RepID=UPI001F346CCD|nr:tRNA lysidine(34) synthetase TilS [Faecalicatena contorta]MCF2554740.1 tRNA lysidine(34) synthetase TilS [Faecalicatena contorta]
MYQKVRAYVEKYHMLEQGDKVIAGVSGGADSVCLLFMLMELSREMHLQITVIHVHHGLRGESADADAAYVQKLCRELHISCRVVYEDVHRYAHERGLTVEEAGRVVRRNAFEAALYELGADKIALAHHRDDNAETLLWNLCRGTGLKGMGAIAPVRGIWIRPLLCLSRKEIESYLEKREVSYCTDESNFENTYTRNKIRNQVIPFLESNINERASEHMAAAAEQMQLLSQYISAEVEKYRKICTKNTENGRLILVKETYEKVPETLKPYVVHEVLCEASGHRKDIEAVHIRLLHELFKKQTGRSIQLPYGITAYRCYEGIEFASETEEQEIEEGKVHFRVFPCTDEIREAFPQIPYTKWFDYDIIKNTVKIRHRQPGDYITIDASGRTQKLKQYFINEKIPREERERIWLAADGSHIMWIIGYRQNQIYQITDKTKRILEMEFDGGKRNGRDSKSND